MLKTLSKVSKNLSNTSAFLVKSKPLYISFCTCKAYFEDNTSLSRRFFSAKKSLQFKSLIRKYSEDSTLAWRDYENYNDDDLLYQRELSEIYNKCLKALHPFYPVFEVNSNLYYQLLMFTNYSNPKDNGFSKLLFSQYSDEKKVLVNFVYNVLRLDPDLQRQKRILESIISAALNICVSTVNLSRTDLKSSLKIILQTIDLFKYDSSFSSIYFRKDGPYHKVEKLLKSANIRSSLNSKTFNDFRTLFLLLIRDYSLFHGNSSHCMLANSMLPPSIAFSKMEKAEIFLRLRAFFQLMEHIDNERITPSEQFLDKVFISLLSAKNSCSLKMWLIHSFNKGWPVKIEFFVSFFKNFSNIVEGSMEVYSAYLHIIRDHYNLSDLADVQAIFLSRFILLRKKEDCKKLLEHVLPIRQLFLLNCYSLLNVLANYVVVFKDRLIFQEINQNWEEHKGQIPENFIFSLLKMFGEMQENQGFLNACIYYINKKKNLNEVSRYKINLLLLQGVNSFEVKDFYRKRGIEIMPKNLPRFFCYCLKKNKLSYALKYIRLSGLQFDYIVDCFRNSSDWTRTLISILSKKMGTEFAIRFLKIISFPLLSNDKVLREIEFFAIHEVNFRSLKWVADQQLRILPGWSSRPQKATFPLCTVHLKK
ncbi:cytochrome b translation regulator Cbp8 [Schizosaccharomyces pombe]|uniref:Cytochrome b translation regulator cbp8 n=1 Tax=Schizosaccharomyces pombe (strain 972 / ATCC 24843) TaxID=284812 RepID=CBP8_SCHPO|nr:uncharacterized protein SPAC22H10.09 [Schizosaccharomyces pombe]Q10302.1 RecName: Full=Uncharacterized protein C22H10.09 [Schizosaccharomyces pombe 972h-]CAA93610.1 sequence orphan [Schizosaccharomyces pombe]|eukprot:NP_593746.1 uncharacterized protein SPAC22H10.09 [Schizosaccharomyces pombe]